MKQYVYKKHALKNSLNKMFAIIWGKFTSGVQSVFKGEANFEK